MREAGRETVRQGGRTVEGSDGSSEGERDREARSK